MNPIQMGRDYMFFGDMMAYRVKLGLSKAVLADIIGVGLPTLYRWETWGPLSKLTNKNAESVTRFIHEADKVLQDFPNFAERFISLGPAVQKMGLTQEIVLGAINKEIIWAWDFGLLGLFFERTEVRNLRRKVVDAM